LDEILTRKRREITAYGFTLWSFAPARAERVLAWRAELARSGQDRCAAVCCGASTADPYTGEAPVVWATEYSEDLVSWRPLPSKRMTSYHRPATKDGLVASAFFTSWIDTPARARVERPREWFRAADGEWELEATVPTRGQYLVRRPALADRGSEVRVLLTVDSPFVVWVR
jgi:hypothetical protein